MKPAFVILTLAGSGCTAAPGPAAWAVDPMWLDPSEDLVTGFQTWEFFDDGWTSGYGERHYVCGVVVRVEGVPAADPCEGCDASWEVDARVTETDCPFDDVGRFTTLQGVGVGPAPEGLTDEAPHPGLSLAAWADYGDGWVGYGWAFPAAIEEQGTRTEWDGDAPLTLRPTLLWEVD